MVGATLSPPLARTMFVISVTMTTEPFTGRVCPSFLCVCLMLGIPHGEATPLFLLTSSKADDLKTLILNISGALSRELTGVLQKLTTILFPHKERVFSLSLKPSAFRE